MMLLTEFTFFCSCLPKRNMSNQSTINTFSFALFQFMIKLIENFLSSPNKLIKVSNFYYHKLCSLILSPLNAINFCPKIR